MIIREIVIEGRPRIEELTSLLLLLQPWGASMDAIVDADARPKRPKREPQTRARGLRIDAENARAEVEAIIDLVSGDFGVPRERILSASRSTTLTEPRAAIVWLSRYVRGHLTTLIADALNFRDHTSVVYHSRRAYELRDGNQAFCAALDRLAAVVRETVR